MSKPKKEGKIVKAYRLHTEGLKIKDIATKMKLNEKIVRAYIWRGKNPDKYKALLKRYNDKKKKARLASNSSENNEEKV